MSELIEAKRKLYLLLLHKQSSEMTQAELSILYDLSQDDDIQKILTGSKSREEAIKRLRGEE